MILEPKVACTLCGSPDDSVFHCIYDCPCVPASLDLDRTERIIEEAREKAHTCPIFWFRGLPPSDWYPELPVADDPFVEDFGSLDIMGGHVFTDGSGPPPLWLWRRVDPFEWWPAEYARRGSWHTAWQKSISCKGRAPRCSRSPSTGQESHAASRHLD